MGLDFGLFNNTLNGSIEYFYKYTSDILAPVEKAGILGQNVSESNVGAVSNKGIEVNLSYNGRIGRDFQFSIAPNFTWVKNAVEELANGATEEINNNRIVGQPIGIIYGYQTEGLFVDQAEINAAPEQLVGKSDLKPAIYVIRILVVRTVYLMERWMLNMTVQYWVVLLPSSIMA